MDVSLNSRPKNKYNIQQVADDSLEGADSLCTKDENDSNQTVQNRKDELKLRIKFRGCIKPRLKSLTLRRA